jgi:hypothetical protein
VGLKNPVGLKKADNDNDNDKDNDKDININNNKYNKKEIIKIEETDNLETKFKKTL